MSAAALQPPTPVVEPAARRPIGHRRVPVLADHQVDHYPEFSTFLAATFGLDADPFGPPALLRVDDRFYELIFVGYSGRPFPAGITIAALVSDLEPLDEHQTDLDLWAVITWLVRGVGGEWDTEALATTGRIYRIAGAGS
jgi:hypothetical protein